MKSIIINATLAAALLFAGQAVAVDAAAAKALAQKSGCFNCHAIDSQILGPAWKDVGAKYAKDASAKNSLIGKVKNGTKGAWPGGNAMPAQGPRVSDSDIGTLVDFILSLK